VLQKKKKSTKKGHYSEKKKSAAGMWVGGTGGYENKRGGKGLSPLTIRRAGTENRQRMNWTQVRDL